MNEFCWCGSLVVRLFTDQQFVDDQPQTINIGARGNWFTLDLFRGDIRWCVDYRVRGCDGAKAEIFGNSKVSQISVDIFIKKIVLWLDVPMHDIFEMRDCQCRGDLFK